MSKKKREMVLLRGESVLRTYRIALGREPVGAKRAEGDGRTPEGRYTIDRRNARSKYHLSLHISYQDAADVARAQEADKASRERGVIMPSGCSYFDASTTGIAKLAGFRM